MGDRESVVQGLELTAESFKLGGNLQDPRLPRDFCFRQHSGVPLSVTFTHEQAFLPGRSLGQSSFISFLTSDARLHHSQRRSTSHYRFEDLAVDAQKQ